MTIEKKLTIADFEKNGVNAPCGLDQTQLKEGKRVYPPMSEYHGLSEIGLKKREENALQRDAGNSR